MGFKDIPAKTALACTLLLALSGCSKETLNGSGGTQSGGGTPPPAFTGPDPNAGFLSSKKLRERAANADSYAITYGALTPSIIATLKTYPLVIVHPYNGDITRDQIMQIKQGVKADDPSDNVVVLCYISIGEDSRTFKLSDAQMRSDARFTGDGSGPVIDPRGPGPSGRPLTGLDPRGTPTNGGFASYYVNDNAVRCNGAPNKSPDQNGNFLTRFVNAGDPLWYATVKDMLMDISSHTPPGLRELFTETYGRGLGCDGVFLDTVDTAAPNKYTTCSDSNHSSSEWTAKGFSDFIGRMRSDYPDKVILQNRGLFFFDPREPHYQVSARGKIDIGFFESYHLDNDSLSTISPYFPDNKYNSAPKLMAEANRPDGFKVLSLGYADGFNGPKPGMDLLTLLNNSGNGLQIFKDDIQEAHSVGFRHYITNAQVDFVNSFVKNNADMTDTSPPVWSSVYNANYDPPEAMAPRVGIQQAASNNAGSVAVSWDVALDMNRVNYVLYYAPFDFSADPDFANATRVVLSPAVGAGYSDIWSQANPNTALQSFYPYQSTISGLTQGVTYYFIIRAVDSKGNEDSNRVVLTAQP
ncbi:fibronectin type III domain-containing protein [Pelotalea chapellei]|uniref:Fibronectin type III domain-containing protein n=1 Tax=Pelotalea chapellei TaxID=44671 RepID=A0ABS5U849_9BACT|nr:fibronectin type III domain-containing protein [Pelotalea chapellei]MBT1071849.1 fibronectin type III domain-containing protein [Pelotalea chapellei]